jgi:hypothetical protein
MRLRRFFLPLAILVGLSTPDVLAQKTDMIQMPNGDRIYGDIKYVERGRLSYSVSHMNRLNIDWVQVQRVSSVHLFEFELSNSRRLFGSIEEGDQDGFMVVTSDTGRSFVRIADVVNLEPLYQTFWGKLKGSSMEIGVDFTRVNLQRQWNLTTKIRYREKLWQLTFDGQSYLNIQEGRDPSNRNNASLTPQRFLSRGYSVYGILKAEQNDELNLELRGTAVLGISRFLARSNRSTLEGRLGLALNEEKFAGSERTTSAEALVSLDYSLFKFIVPKIDFRIDGFVFPSLTEWGRYRGNFNSAIVWEPISDFRISLNGFFVFDTRPAEGAENIDYGAFSSVGISI